MTGPEGGPLEERASPAPPRPAVPPHRPTRSTLHALPGRWAAVGLVLIAVVAVAVISAVFPAAPAAPAPGSADGVPVPPAEAYSSSAFCTAGTGSAAATTIYLTNSTSRTVSGVMTTVGQARAGGSVPTVRRTVAVPALGGDAVNPSAGLPGGSIASSFVFAGGGVVANQVVSGPGGWSTAPCASQTSAQWAFAGGSTAAGSTMRLSLLNPASPEAVVNVSFLTSGGLVTPQAYQGLVIPPGRLVVENVGDFVQKDADIATLVTAQSGALVAAEFEQQSPGGSGGMSLRLGSPSLSTRWRFAQTTTAPGSSVDFHLGNPDAAAVTATVSVGLSSGTVVPRRVVVPPRSVVGFAASGASGFPQQIPYSVTVTSSAPIVVGRSVKAAAGSPAPVWGASSGTATTATHWLVPGPGVPHAPGTAGAAIKSLAVANPGPSAARVEVATLAGTHPVASFTVAPNGVAVLSAKQVGGLSVLSVLSSQPVYVEEDSGPSGAPGVVSSTGFPFVDGG